MKKLLLLTAVISLVSWNCMAGLFGSRSTGIKIINNTDNVIRANDNNGHEVTVQPGKTRSLDVRIHKKKVLLAEFMDRVATVTITNVRGDDAGDSNSIKITGNTGSITV